jgi:hypothetical protein
VTNAGNRHVYYILTRTNWTASQAQAIRMGGDLVTISDSAEQIWVYGTFGNFRGAPRSLWIGLNDHDQFGTFVWMSGESSNYRNWALGEPTGDNGVGLFTHIWPPGYGNSSQWNDLGDLTSFVRDGREVSLHAVVETDPTRPLVSLVPLGSAWRYLDDGSDAGTAWVHLDFDDRGWASGRAQLGYGDGDEVTTTGFGGNSTNRFITTYFRHAFLVENPANFEQLVLHLLRDDGAVVYHNGAELFRNNLPEGVPIHFGDRALIAVGGADENFFVSHLFNPQALRVGTNLLAVEIHQERPESSDISFDLGLRGALVRPTLEIAEAGLLIELSWPLLPAGFRLQSSAAIPGGPWSSVAANPASSSGRWVLTLPRPPQTTFYRLSRP